MRNFLLSLLLLTASFGLWGEALPEWMVLLRDAIYEQKLKADEIVPLYRSAKTEAQEQTSGTVLDLALSRCEYFMGRALHYEKRNNEARVHYNEGMRLAEKALAVKPSDVAWVMRAENLSQACAVSSMSFAIGNGLDVEKFAKNALSLNSRNAAAQLIVAARWVYAPAPLNNHKKGIEMMQAVLVNSDMEKDDLFNAYIGIGYGYVQQKKYDEARPWLLKALEVYPTNKFAAEQLAKK